MKSSFMDYAMSVIVSRALPDVRDGLKPVHRRILYTQHGLNNVWNRAVHQVRARRRRRARQVSTRTATPPPTTRWCAWRRTSRCATRSSTGRATSARSTAIRPAAYRYTECRMEKIGGELLADIDKETVDFQPNYDDKETEPTVLPARFPNLLVNGAAGIAVGMATNIPPHNLREIDRRDHRRHQEPRHHHRRADRDRPRPGLPDRRLHLRARRHPQRLRDGPRRHPDARRGPPSRSTPRPGASRSSRPRSPTRSTRPS